MQNTKLSFYELEVQFEEIDQGGVVYHPNYFTYLERARNNQMKKAGFPLSKMLSDGFVFALAKAELEFKKTCKLHDLLTICSFVDEIRSASLTITQIILKGVSLQEAQALGLEQILNHSQLTLKAKIKLACINVKKLSPIKIPEAIVEILK